jgi:hypothetical protein
MVAAAALHMRAQACAEKSQAILPCPPHPCPRLLSIRASPAAAVLSLHRAAPQVQLERRLDRVPCALWRRLVASERARRPCCCGAALQLADGGAGCLAAVSCSGPPEVAPGGCRWPRATRAPGSLHGLSRAPGGAPERGRGMASARRPCAPAPDRAPPVLGRSTYRRRQVGGALGGRTRLARSVRVLSACFVVRGGRSVCHAGTSLTVEMASVVKYDHFARSHVFWGDFTRNIRTARGLAISKRG